MVERTPTYYDTFSQAITATETSTNSHTIQRSSAAPTITPAPPIIQRDDDENDDESDDNDSDSSASAPDIDQIANQVYSQLRRRLSVEWERGRGKR
jgi:hypothetical protein